MSSKQESSKMSNMDPSHPYYVHHSDQPGHMLVPTKLNGANYQSWCKAMVHALTAKNKIGFIDGTIEPPSAVDAPSDFAMWNQCNSMILSWLTHSAEPDIAEGVVHAKTAQQVWEDLRDQFSQKNAPAIFQVQKSIATMTQGSMSVAAYYTKLKGLWAELDTYRTHVVCNQEKQHNDQKEEYRLMQFLMGLNDTYKTVRSNILMMSPLPNVRQAYSLVIQEETQRNMGSDSTENFSIVAAVPGRSGTFKSSKEKNCAHCNRTGHTIDECRTLKFHCNFCNKRGHTEDRCRLKGQGTRPPQTQQSRGRGKNFSAINMADASQPSSDASSSNLLQGFSPEQLQQLATALSAISNSGNSDALVNAAGRFLHNPFINSCSTTPWILDSGATDHIASDLSILSKTQPSSVPTVHLPTGSVAHISHTGTVCFNSNFSLENVLCVPSFNLNLMSTSKLTSALNCCVIFFPTFCVLQDLATGKMIGSGKQQGGLYYMTPSPSPSAANSVLDSSQLWHRRLGHPSSSHLKLIAQFLDSHGFLDYLERVASFDQNNNNLIDKLQDAIGRNQNPISILPSSLSELKIITISGSDAGILGSGAKYTYDRFPSNIRSEEQEEKRKQILAVASGAFDSPSVTVGKDTLSPMERAAERERMLLDI